MERDWDDRRGVVDVDARSLLVSTWIWRARHVTSRHCTELAASYRHVDYRDIEFEKSDVVVHEQ